MYTWLLRTLGTCTPKTHLAGNSHTSVLSTSVQHVNASRIGRNLTYNRLNNTVRIHVLRAVLF